MKDDHIGPIDGLHFMSLNMTLEQVAVISRAILHTKQATPEAALADICDQYLAAMEWSDLFAGEKP